MNRDGHVATGAMSGVLLGMATGSGPLGAAACTAVAGAAALLPDIDHPTATITRLLGPPGRLVSWLVRKLSLGVYTLTKTSRDTPGAGGEHRGLTHTALAAVGLWLAVHTAVDLPAELDVVALAVGVGMLAHDCGDALTGQGAPIVWPLPIAGQTWYPVRTPTWMSITGGGPAEKVITGVAWTVVVALLATSVLTDGAPPPALV